MKRCPVCKKYYYDETLEFCLDDGSRLSKAVETETLTVQTGQPGSDPIPAETVRLFNETEKQVPERFSAGMTANPQLSQKKEIIKQNAAATSLRILETAPIVLALAHNYWQWLYLYRQPTYDLVAFFSSYIFLIWLFLLISGLMFGLFSLKYGNNKGFAITALVVLAINMILSIVPK